MFTPTPLFPGARVALLAPASPVAPERLPLAVQAAEALGLFPVIYESARHTEGYLAGSDALRAGELHRAFCDDGIDGIWCLRGGYGTQRLLPLLDLAMISRHPKWFGGFSDITALQLALAQSCGLRTYHTPMPACAVAGGLDDFSLASLREALFCATTTALSVKNPAECPLTTLCGGKARGVLTGGNLGVAAASLGTPWELDTRGKILFLEEVDEEPYRVDRLLTQLNNSGKLQACAGVLLGAFTRCGEADALLADVFRDLGAPVLSGLACGHTAPTLSLRLGATLELDADAQSIREAAP